MVTDYYAMLGVDPGADSATLEAALARNQPIWSSGTRNPKNKHTYQSYLDQIPALRRTLLGDPTVRAAYDAELAAARRVERDRKLDRLQRLIRLRAAKGGLTVADRALLARRGGPARPDARRPRPPGRADPARSPRPRPRPRTSPTRRSTCSTRPRGGRSAWRWSTSAAATCTTPSACRATPPIAEIVARGRRRAAAMDAEGAGHGREDRLARSGLAGAVAPGHPAARARYDRTLALEREEALKGSIEFALKGLSRLDPGTRSALIDEAAALGIAPERADRLIGRACRALGVARDVGAPRRVGGGGRRARSGCCDAGRARA